MNEQINQKGHLKWWWLMQSFAKSPQGYGIPVLGHDALEITPPVFRNFLLIVDDFVQFGRVNSQLRCQSFGADGWGFRQEEAKVSGEGGGFVHCGNTCLTKAGTKF